MTITLFLKLLAPIVLLLSALMQAGLDYLWKDHRTKTHKRARVLAPPEKSRSRRANNGGSGFRRYQRMSI